jgi:hypothetical protein
MIIIGSGLSQENMERLAKQAHGKYSHFDMDKFDQKIKEIVAGLSKRRSKYVKKANTRTLTPDQEIEVESLRRQVKAILKQPVKPRKSYWERICEMHIDDVFTRRSFGKIPVVMKIESVQNVDYHISNAQITTSSLLLITGSGKVIVTDRKMANDIAQLVNSGNTDRWIGKYITVQDESETKNEEPVQVNVTNEITVQPSDVIFPEPEPVDFTVKRDNQGRISGIEQDGE